MVFICSRQNRKTHKYIATVYKSETSGETDEESYRAWLTDGTLEESDRYQQATIEISEEDFRFSSKQFWKASRQLKRVKWIRAHNVYDRDGVLLASTEDIGNGRTILRISSFSLTHIP